MTSLFTLTSQDYSQSFVVIPTYVGQIIINFCLLHNNLPDILFQYSKKLYKIQKDDILYMTIGF